MCAVHVCVFCVCGVVVCMCMGLDMGVDMDVGVCMGACGGVWIWVLGDMCGCEHEHTRSPEEGISISSTFLIPLELLL